MCWTVLVFLKDTARAFPPQQGLITCPHPLLILTSVEFLCDRLVSLRAFSEEPHQKSCRNTSRFCQLNLFCPYILQKVSRPGGHELSTKAAFDCPFLILSYISFPFAFSKLFFRISFWPTLVCVYIHPARALGGRAVVLFAFWTFGHKREEFFVLFQMDFFLIAYSHAKFSGGGWPLKLFFFLLGNVHMLCCDPLIEHLKAISMLHANTWSFLLHSQFNKLPWFYARLSFEMKHHSSGHFSFYCSLKLCNLCSPSQSSPLMAMFWTTKGLSNIAGKWDGSFSSHGFPD